MPKLNPWLEEKLDQVSPPGSLNLLVEAEPDHARAVEQQLRGLGLAPLSSIFGRFIPVPAPLATLDQILGIQEVNTVHYDLPTGIPQSLPFAGNVPRWPSLSMRDPLIGEIRLPTVEIPRIPKIAPLSPIGAALSPLAPALPKGGLKQPGVEIIPTGETRKLLNPPDEVKIFTKVAVIDTGMSPHPIFHPGKTLKIETRVPGETGLDTMGHGQWCSSCAFGDSWNTRFGQVRGVSDPAELLHVKALSTGGSGMTSWIMSAMERAVSYGAKVISMSLGGEQQGPVTEDPYSKVMALTRDRVIWVIAAGNSGPDGWTIGSPGVSPYALTVGAWSPLHNGLAIFSSRGPSGAWYGDHPQDWERDLADFGEDLIKPDLVSPGGGPVEEGQAEDQIYSAVTGWYDGMVDLTPGGWDAMKGTCFRGDTLVSTTTGAKEIWNIEPGDVVYSWAGRDMVTRSVNALMDQGVQPLYRLRLGNREIYATANHPFAVLEKDPVLSETRDAALAMRSGGASYGNIAERVGVTPSTVREWASGAKAQRSGYRLGWKSLASLEPGDEVLTVKQIPGGEAAPPWLTLERARWLGFFIGDGWLSNMGRRTRQVALAGGSDPDLIRHYADIYHRWTGKAMRSTQNGKWWYDYSASFYRFITDLGFSRGASNKTVPDWVFGLPHDHMREFLLGYIDADGWLMERGNAIECGYESVSESLVRRIHLLTVHLGYKTWNISCRNRTTHPPNSKRPVRQTTWRSAFGMSKPYLQGGNLARRLHDHVDPGVFRLAPVKTIEPAGEERVYDIEVDGSHNFIANGIVSHNSMATPHAAGLIALAVDRGLITIADDVKRMIRPGLEIAKSPETGYGFLVWPIQSV